MSGGLVACCHAVEPLTIEDLLLIAEAVLGVPAEALAPATRLASAAAALADPVARDRDHDRERETALADEAAGLCVRLVRARPLPRGNEQVALVAMLELVARNHGIWVVPNGGEKEIATTISCLGSGELSDAAFAAWVRAHVKAPPRRTGPSGAG